MTAPTSPGAVPADIGPRSKGITCQGCPALKEKWWEEYLDNDERDSGTNYTCSATDGRRISGPYGHPSVTTPDWCPVLADRANRPSLTEDEQETDPTVSERMREAIIAPYRNDLKGMDDAEIVGAINHARGIIDEEEPWLEALVAEQERRALADRSEPRQEKEGDRG